MAVTKSDLMMRLEESGETELLQQVESIFSHARVDQLSTPATVAAGDALALWQARQRNALEEQNGGLPGAGRLIARLRQLEPNVLLKQVGIANDDAAVVVFLSGNLEKLVGIVIGESRTSRERRAAG